MPTQPSRTIRKFLLLSRPGQRNDLAYYVQRHLRMYSRTVGVGHICTSKLIYVLHSLICCPLDNMLEHDPMFDPQDEENGRLDFLPLVYTTIYCHILSMNMHRVSEYDMMMRCNGAGDCAVCEHLQHSSTITGVPHSSHSTRHSFSCQEMTPCTET